MTWDELVIKINAMPISLRMQGVAVFEVENRLHDGTLAGNMILSDEISFSDGDGEDVPSIILYSDGVAGSSSET